MLGLKIQVRLHGSPFRTCAPWTRVAYFRPLSSDAYSVEAFRQHILTLLDKAENLVRTDGSHKTRELWQTAINSAREDIGSNWEKDRRKRILVIGTEHSRSEQLVTALLEDPLALNAQDRAIIQHRWAGNKERVIIRQYSNSHPSDGSITIASRFLSRMDADILELKPEPNALDDAIAESISADITLLVTPFTDPIGTSTSPNILRIATCSNDTVDSSWASNKMTVDPSRALEAIDHFLKDSKSASSGTFYFQNLTSSNIRLVEPAMHNILTKPRFQSASKMGPIAKEMEIIKLNAAHSILFGLCSQSQMRNDRHIAELYEIEMAMDHMDKTIEDIKLTSENAVFGSSSTVIEEAIMDSEANLKAALQAYSWWKLPFKVDDLGNDIALVLRNSWCRNLEQKLIFTTGSLSSSQIQLRNSVVGDFEALPRLFRSAVLLNKLEQLCRPAHDLTATSLLEPLSKRRNQLIQYPLNHLHVSAQRAVLTGIGMGFASGTASYLAFLGTWVGAETALGIGLLGTVVGLRAGINIWERAVREWWRNWKRVGEGLERDLRETLRETVGSVIAVPATAVKEFREIWDKHNREAIEREDSIKRLGSEIKDI